MRSFITTVLCLSVIHTSTARVPHSFRDSIQRDAELVQSSPIADKISHFFARLFRRNLEARQDDDSNDSTCYIDEYYNFVQDMNDGPVFCNAFVDYPNVTTTVDYTPTSTVTVFTSQVRTIETVERTNPQSTTTATVTAGGTPVKRDADPLITERGLSRLRIDEVFRNFRRQNEVSSSDGDEASIAAGFSSACSCQDYTGPTVTRTYTDDATIRTLSAFRRTTTTRTATRTGAVRVTTTTITVEVSSSSSSSAPVATTSVIESTVSGTAGTQSGGSQTGDSQTAGSQSGGSSEASGSQITGSQTAGTPTSASSGGPTPTAPAFSCPEDNNSTVSQMIGNRRYDYTVLCNVILTDSDFYAGGLRYDTFGECVAACSVADSRFDYPLCQGVSYFANAANSAGSNCFLKSSANYTTSATGVDSALLQRIQVGVTANDTDGTTTEDAPFSGMTPTGDPQEMSSMMSSIFSNSSNTMPVITPPPAVVQSGMMVNRPFTAYSTYVSDGTTYSSGTQSSFATTYANGSWVSYYYNTYTLAWASATTVYGATETGYTIANSSDSNFQQSNGDNGEYSTINTTTINSYGPGYRNETTIITNQTYAANGTQIGSTATTLFNSYETGGADAGGGSGGPASGGPSGVSATSTAAFSTVIVISNSGGTGGASSFITGGEPSQTVVPLTTIVSSGDTAYSTVIYQTGIAGGTGGASSIVASGGPGGTGGATSVVASGGPGATGGELSVVASGGPEETGGATSDVASGGPTFNPTIPISVGMTSGETAGGTVIIISGAPTGTEGASSNITSGGPTSPFSNTGDDRSGTLSTTSSVNATAPTGTGSTSIPLLTGTSGLYTGPPQETASTNTSTGTFTNTNDNRSPFPSSSTPSGTAPSINSTDSTGPTGTQPTAPSGYGYASPSGTGTFTNTNDNRSPFPSSSSSPPPGTGLSSYSAPSGTGPSGTGTFTNTNDNRSPFPSSGSPPPGNSTAPPPTGSYPGPGYRSYNPFPPPSSSPPGTAPTNTTQTGTFTNTNDNRSPFPSSSTPSVPPPLTTGPSTCVNMTMGTTTLLVTTTVLGCDSTCVPWGGYYGGGPPQTFGPPVFETTSSEEPSATESTSSEEPSATDASSSQTVTVINLPPERSMEEMTPAEPTTTQTSTVTSTATS